MTQTYPTPLGHHTILKIDLEWLASLRCAFTGQLDKVCINITQKDAEVEFQ